ncbi:MAG: hemolysin III family protein [Helicobacteraceae bacterium]|nr:hemolysin III family protein [Helicobacteraceae bacterium]
MKKKANDFSVSEEIWHAITHGVGLLLSVVALLFLFTISLDNSLINIFSATIYGVSLVIMYGSSTLYHASAHNELKHLLQKFDHSAIYFLIAGTYTPVMLLCVGGVEGVSIFITEWLIAFVGIFLKFKYPRRFEALSLVAYVVMGWMIILVFDSFKNNIDEIGFYLMIAGGVAYTSGIVFYIKDKINYFHAIWHLFVLAGSTFQFFAIAFYII